MRHVHAWCMVHACKRRTMRSKGRLVPCCALAAWKKGQRARTHHHHLPPTGECRCSESTHCQFRSFFSELDEKPILPQLSSAQLPAPLPSLVPIHSRLFSGSPPQTLVRDKDRPWPPARVHPNPYKTPPATASRLLISRLRARSGRASRMQAAPAPVLTERLMEGYFWLRDYITAIRSGRCGEMHGVRGRRGTKALGPCARPRQAPNAAHAAAAVNNRIHPFTVVERKARAATRDEAW